MQKAEISIDISDHLAQTLSGSTDTEKVLYEDITLTTGLILISN